MEYAIAALILVALGFLYYGWIRLRQEAEAKARQLIFRKSHREGEGAVGRSHRVTPRSASAQELLDRRSGRHRVARLVVSHHFQGAKRRPEHDLLHPQMEVRLPQLDRDAVSRRRRITVVERPPSETTQRSGARSKKSGQFGATSHQGTAVARSLLRRDKRRK